MIQFLKDLSIGLKISGFVIPSTIAFGVVMTFLSLYFLNDYKDASLNDFRLVIEEIQQTDQSAGQRNSTALLEEISKKADEKINKIAIFLISIVIAVIIMAAIGAMIILLLSENRSSV